MTIVKDSSGLSARFPIGSHFTVGCKDEVWRVTDVGTRVVVAVARRSGWMAGPPYALAEVVFDEHDQAVMCSCEEPPP